MKQVTDPDLLRELEAGSSPNEGLDGGGRLKPVTDPDLVRQLGEEPNTALDVAGNLVRGFNKGLVGLATAPYRAIDWVAETVTGGQGLPDADKMPLYEPYLNQPKPETEAGRIARSFGEGVGSSAIPSAGIMSVAPRIAAGSPTIAQTTKVLPGIVRNIAETTAKSPGRVLAADVIASGGAGVGQQLAEDDGMGPAGQMAAGLVGAVAPVVAVGGVERLARAAQPIVSPTLARWNADLAAFRRKHGIVASADGGTPPNVGAQAAAEQKIANQLHRAGRTVDDLRTALDDAAENARFHSSGVAQNALAPVDLDDSLRRLAGSAVRASPEAGNIAQSFVFGRQTGVTPSDGLLPPTSGVPTRPMMSRPMTGVEAERTLGSRFDTPKDKNVPMGQAERVGDAFKRALLLEDEAFHGHAANSTRTQQAMSKALTEEANKLYPKAWEQAEDFDLSAAFKGLDDLKAELNDPRVHGILNRMQRLFSRTDGNGAPLSSASELKRFDLAKQRLDGLIDDVRGKDSFLYRALTKFKHDLLSAVHGGDRNNPTRNTAYRDAREYYHTQKEMQDAIDLGRAVFKEDSDIGVDAFRSMETKAQQKLFRLGLLGGYEAAAKRLPRGSDATRLFDNPRIQELLSEVIPRTETATGRAKAGATFANRPERFGGYIGDEKRMIKTRDEVLGNSKTQQRKVDDEAYDDMNALGEAIDKFRQSGSLVNVGIKSVEAVIHKLFGMRADTAAALARSLFTANPQQRAMILARIEARMGPDRFSHFSRLIQQNQAALAPAGTAAIAGPDVTE
jgi:hypothetical protein